MALAEDAFFHPSIMSLSYFSIEHYLAIYMVSKAWMFVDTLQPRALKPGIEKSAETVYCCSVPILPCLMETQPS